MAKHDNSGLEDPRKEIREAMVARVFDLAIDKAEKLTKDDEFEVTLLPADRPEGSHNGEIAGELSFRSGRLGLIYLGYNGWSYRFKKMVL